ncbi:MAG: DUF1614 domain-containing protein, partial [Nitrospirae bacterium]
MLFAPALLLLYLALLAGLFVLLQLHLITYAFAAIGLSPEAALLLLAATLAGSYVNLPVTRVRSGPMEVAGRVVRFWGVRFVVPVPVRPQETVVAVNVGGALIPAAVALYLLLDHPGIALRALLATAAVALAVHRVARPVRGLGIATPALLPPLFAVLAAWLLAPHEAARVAYVAGTLGTLVGADLM